MHSCGLGTQSCRRVRARSKVSAVHFLLKFSSIGRVLDSGHYLGVARSRPVKEGLETGYKARIGNLVFEVLIDRTRDACLHAGHNSGIFCTCLQFRIKSHAIIHFLLDTIEAVFMLVWKSREVKYSARVQSRTLFVSFQDVPQSNSHLKVRSLVAHSLLDRLGLERDRIVRARALLR